MKNNLTRNRILNFTSKTQNSIVSFIEKAKNKVDYITGKMDPVPDEIHKDCVSDRFYIVHYKKMIKKSFPISIFSWKMFFYGWIGISFLIAKRYIIGGVLIAFFCLYCYKIYSVTNQLTQSISKIEYSNNTSISDIKSKIKHDSTTFYDISTLVISIFCGFFGNVLIVRSYLKHGWKIYPVNKKTADLIKKRFFLYSYNFNITQDKND
jgi:hypothetical protein